jgi:hypothetical protein
LNNFFIYTILRTKYNYFQELKNKDQVLIPQIGREFAIRSELREKEEIQATLFADLDGLARYIT